jgi:hypothetical protein
MLSLLIASLAIFWAWETLTSLLPWYIPAWLHPAIVFAMSLGFVWPDWRTAMATAGAVALLHVLVRQAAPAPQAVRMATLRNRVPRLP